MYALKIVVLNARVSIGFTLEEFFNSLFCNFAVRGVFFLKISIMSHDLFTADGIFFWVLGRWWGFIWWSPLSFSYPSVLVTLTIPTLWVQFLVVFNSFKQLQCLLFLGFEYKMIINYSSLMRVWKVQSNSFPFVYLSCFSHCVGMLISNLSVVMPLIGVE